MRECPWVQVMRRCNPLGNTSTFDRYISRSELPLEYLLILLIPSVGSFQCNFFLDFQSLLFFFFFFTHTPLIIIIISSCTSHCSSYTGDTLDRSFDIIAGYYGTQKELTTYLDPMIDFKYKYKHYKIPSLKFLHEELLPGLLTYYDAVYALDNDILMNTAMIDDMFATRKVAWCESVCWVSCVCMWVDGWMLPLLRRETRVC